MNKGPANRGEKGLHSEFQQRGDVSDAIRPNEEGGGEGPPSMPV
jgi:hypothetical protein